MSLRPAGQSPAGETKQHLDRHSAGILPGYLPVNAVRTKPGSQERCTFAVKSHCCGGTYKGKKKSKIYNLFYRDMENNLKSTSFQTPKSKKIFTRNVRYKERTGKFRNCQYCCNLLVDHEYLV